MKTSFLFIGAMFFAACGPSPAELDAKEKAFTDSVEKAEENHIAMQKDILDSIILFKEDQRALIYQLESMKTQLKNTELILEKLKRSGKPDQFESTIKAIDQLSLQIHETEKQIVN